MRTNRFRPIVSYSGTERAHPKLLRVGDMGLPGRQGTHGPVEDVFLA